MKNNTERMEVLIEGTKITVGANVVFCQKR